MKNGIVILLFAFTLISCEKENSIKVEKGTLITNITFISSDENKVKSFLGHVVIDGAKIIYTDIRNDFKAATYNNAKAFHLKSKYGRIIEGNITNVLILNSNPLVSVDA